MMENGHGMGAKSPYGYLSVVLAAAFLSVALTANAQSSATFADPNLDALDSSGNQIAGLSPLGSGTISPPAGSHGYAAGTMVAVTATANTGWQSDHWTVDGTDSGSAATVSVTMDADKAVVEPISLIGLVPNAGPVAGGTPVRIQGLFPIAADIETIAEAAAAYNVYFGDTLAVFDGRVPPIVNTDSMYVITPAHAAGTVDVLVEDAAYPANADMLASAFTYIGPPSLVSIDPNQGQAAGGTYVAITGLNLATARGVYFGPVAAETRASGLLVITDDLVAAYTPAGAAGPVDVTIITDAGQGTLTDGFTYVLAATRTLVISVSPAGSGTIDPPAGPHVYPEGTAVDVTAFQNVGWQFDHWTLDGIDSGSYMPLTIVMEADRTVTAVFVGAGGEGEGEGEMVTVPATRFLMGARPGEQGDASELPAHWVSLDEYRIGKYEVTNAEYAAMLNWALARGYLETLSGGAYTGDDVYESGKRLISLSYSSRKIDFRDGEFIVKTQDDLSMADHPVMEVSWYGAVAYCNWRSQMANLSACYSFDTWERIEPVSDGYRLPTEAEWECAAGWNSERQQHWLYGVQSDTITTGRCNYNRANPLRLSSYPWTTPVGYYNGSNPGTTDSPSPVACYDMSGNIREWCHDWDGAYAAHDEQNPAENPTGPPTGPARVQRGGSWDNTAFYCRVACRVSNDPSSTQNVVGFRIARGGEPRPVPPTAAFSATPTTGNSPLTVDFTDLSSPGSGSITDWSWDFGDGGTSTEQNPTGHEYSHSQQTPQTYDVSLTVTTAVGSHTYTRRAYITVYPAAGPLADFSAMPTLGNAPLTVTFRDLSSPGSSPITDWLWDFGDGHTSTEPPIEQPVTHLYDAEGTYDVSLTVVTAEGSDTRIRSAYITVTQPDGEDVYGVVTDAATGLPLADVQVELFKVATGDVLATTTTSAGGAYGVSGGESGMQLGLRFSKVGYDDKKYAGIYARRVLNVSLTPSEPTVAKVAEAAAGADEVQLWLSVNREPDLAGYNIYRDVNDGQGLVLLNDNPLEDTEYHDKEAVQYAVCIYRVSAVDTEGNEGALSDPVELDPQRLVALPADVRGEAGKDVRVPINLKNVWGVNPQGIALKFAYDPALVASSQEEGTIRVEPTAISRNVQFSSDVSESGIVNITSTSVSGDPLHGEGHLFDVYLPLRTDAPQNQCSPVGLTEAVFFDIDGHQRVTDISDSGQLCVTSECKQGDLDGNGMVDSADATMALQIAVEAIDPTECQRTAGDINGDGVIDSADALLILRLSTGLPLNPTGPDGTPSAVIRHVRIAEAHAGPGGTAVVPVTLSDAGGLTGFDLKVAYSNDPDLVLLDKVTAGVLTGTGSEIGTNHEEGFMQVSMIAPAPLAQTAGEGVLAELRFQVAETAPVGEEFPIKLSDIQLKGQYGDSVDWYATIERVDGVIVVDNPTILVVSVPTVEVEAAAGTFEITVDNAGEGTMPWVAEVASGADWLTITSGGNGTNQGTVLVRCESSSQPFARLADVVVTSSGAANSPLVIPVTQCGYAPFGLGCDQDPGLFWQFLGSVLAVLWFIISWIFQLRPGDEG